MDEAEMLCRQRGFGYTQEDIKFILGPMTDDAAEPIGSMGDDAPTAVLSSRMKSLSAYFRQEFAQVTNPPIDPIREDVVMSLKSYLGRDITCCRRLKKLQRRVWRWNTRCSDRRNFPPCVRQNFFAFLVLPLCPPPKMALPGWKAAVERLCEQSLAAWRRWKKAPIF